MSCSRAYFSSAPIDLINWTSFDATLKIIIQIKKYIISYMVYIFTYSIVDDETFFVVWTTLQKKILSWMIHGLGFFYYYGQKCCARIQSKKRSRESCLGEQWEIEKKDRHSTRPLPTPTTTPPVHYWKLAGGPSRVFFRNGLLNKTFWLIWLAFCPKKSWNTCQK